MAFGQLRQVHISMPEEYDVDVDDDCEGGDDDGEDEEEVDHARGDLGTLFQAQVFYIVVWWNKTGSKRIFEKNDF